MELVFGSANKKNYLSLNPRQEFIFWPANKKYFHESKPIEKNLFVDQPTWKLIESLH